MRTCRASIGWSRDNRHLYLLTVKEPDEEGSSSVALSFAVRGLAAPPGTQLTGGWTVPDVQNFGSPKEFGVRSIQTPAGSLQMVYRHPNAAYTFRPRLARKLGFNVIECGTDWEGAIQGGGAIMYFMVREK